jgi:hypothetical protein
MPSTGECSDLKYQFAAAHDKDIKNLNAKVVSYRNQKVCSDADVSLYAHNK